MYPPSEPMTRVIDMKKLQLRTQGEANAQLRQAQSHENNFSLRELINTQMEHRLWSPNPLALSAAYELSNSCRERSGVQPNGIWVPLASLTRDLTFENANALTTGKIENKLQAALAPSSAVMAGATLLSGLQGATFSIPVVDSPLDANASWVNEGGEVGQLELTTKLATLEPKSLVFSVVISRRLLANASVDIEADLRAHILRRAMIAIDRAALNGAGGVEPSGLLNDAGLQVLAAGTNGLAPTWDHLVEAEYQVSNRAGSLTAPTFISSPAIRKKLRKTQRAAGLDFIVNESAGAVMGHPLRTSAIVPDNLDKGTSVGTCSALIFGDLAEIIVGFWGPLAIDILIDPHTLGKEGKVRLVCRAEVGVAVRNIGAFTAYKDLLAA